MSTYKQFCPMAMATELLCQRWNLIILRELHLGSCNFNTIRKGVPKISPALLSQRLKYLENHKLIFLVLITLFKVSGVGALSAPYSIRSCFARSFVYIILPFDLPPPSLR